MAKKQGQNKTVFSDSQELPRWMTLNDVALALRISLAGAYHLAESPDFPVTLFNSQKRVKRDKFLQWMKAKERKVSWRN